MWKVNGKLFFIFFLFSILFLNSTCSYALFENNKDKTIDNTLVVVPYDKSVLVVIPNLEQARKYRIYLSNTNADDLKDLNEDNSKKLVFEHNDWIGFIYLLSGHNDINFEPDVEYCIYLVVDIKNESHLASKVIFQVKQSCEYWTDQGNYDTTWYDQDPIAKEFKIYSSKELAGLSVLVNGMNGRDSVDFEEKTVYLCDNVCMFNFLWTPIGQYHNDCGYKSFKGVFKSFIDVDDTIKTNMVISGLHTNNRKKNQQGLFGFIDSGEVKKITLDCGCFAGQSGVGSIVALNNGNILYCRTDAIVMGEKMVGGICGRNFGSISRSLSNGFVIGNQNVGGITGYNYGEIFLAVNSEKVFSKFNVGGIAGCNEKIVIRCANIANIFGESNVGGIIGVNKGKIRHANNRAIIKGKCNIGGIIGATFTNDSIIEKCYNHGVVLGKFLVDGLVGKDSGGKKIASKSLGEVICEQTETGEYDSVSINCFE